MILSYWQTGDFFVDLGDYIVIFANNWKDALFIFHEYVK